MINEAKLVLFLLTLGAQNGTNHQMALEKLDKLVSTKIEQSQYTLVKENCLTTTSVFDYMVTSNDKIVVDYDLLSVSEDQECQKEKDHFCRAIFNKNEELELVNCR